MYIYIYIYTYVPNNKDAYSEILLRENLAGMSDRFGCSHTGWGVSGVTIMSHELATEMQYHYKLCYIHTHTLEIRDVYRSMDL